MPESEEIVIRSEAVQDIIGSSPNWMIRWGTSLIFVIVILAVVGSIVLSYPDVIVGELVLRSENPTLRIVCPSSTRVQKLHFEDGEMVSKGQLIAELQNPFSSNELEYLTLLSEDVNQYLATSELPRFRTNISLGELTTAHEAVKKSISEHHAWSSAAYNSFELEQLRSQVNNHLALSAINQREIDIYSSEIETAEIHYSNQEALYADSIISMVRLGEEQSKYRSKQLSFEEMKKAGIQLKIKIEELKAELFELQHRNSEKERTMLEDISSSMNQIDAAIELWKQGFVLTAPNSGRLSYLTKLSENQYVEAETELFAVIPEEGEIYGTLSIPAKGAGKVQIGQLALIEVAKYPKRDYGQLEARVSKMADLQVDGAYQVELRLSNSMTTTHKASIDFSPEMIGQAQIITEDKRLIQRVLGQLDGIFE